MDVDGAGAIDFGSLGTDFRAFFFELLRLGYIKLPEGISLDFDGLGLRDFFFEMASKKLLDLSSGFGNIYDAETKQLVDDRWREYGF